MAQFANNVLQTVQTYQRASLGYLQNLCAFVSTMNTKFKDFNKIEANLGSSVTFDLPPRATTSQGLVATFQSATQRLQTLTCDQAANASFSVTSQERIFNLEKGEEEYMSCFGKSFMMELANQIEANLAKNATSAVPVNTVDQDGQTVPTGALHVESGPFRVYGDGNTPITSYGQLARAVTMFRNFGAVSHGIKVYLPDTIVPSIMESGLNQFAPERNDEDAMSWEIGEFGTPPVKYYRSNLLPIHEAGNIGNDATVLTLVSVDDPTGNNITQLTFSGAAASDAEAIKAGDILTFSDGVSGQPNMRYLTFIGHTPSDNQVQVRATADAASDGAGQITISITPSLNWAGGQNQNLNNALAPGMQVTALPSHRAGLIVGGGAMYLAMPKLPSEDPYPTGNEYDPETGVSMRMYYGSLFGQNQRGLINDCTWGSTVVPEYSMRIAIPLSQR